MHKLKHLLLLTLMLSLSWSALANTDGLPDFNDNFGDGDKNIDINTGDGEPGDWSFGDEPASADHPAELRNGRDFADLANQAFPGIATPPNDPKGPEVVDAQGHNRPAVVTDGPLAAGNDDTSWSIGAGEGINLEDVAKLEGTIQYGDGVVTTPNERTLIQEEYQDKVRKDQEILSGKGLSTEEVQEIGTVLERAGKQKTSKSKPVKTEASNRVDIGKVDLPKKYSANFLEEELQKNVGGEDSTKHHSVKNEVQRNIALA